MAETIEELNVDWEEDGKVVTRTLKKEVLTKGTWATLLFLFQDMDRKTGEWGPPKMTIRRYQKSGGKYMQRSKFNISSVKQARQMCEIINQWISELGETPNEESEEG